MNAFSGLMGGGNKEAPGQMIEQQSGREQQLLNEVAGMPPSIPNVSTAHLDKLVTAQALLNAYKSRAAQGELRPDILAGEKLGDAAVLSDAQNAQAGRLPIGVQNALAKAGLATAIASGSVPTAGSKGMAGAAEVFGSGSQNYIQRMIDRLTGHVEANPAPAIGLSPESAGNITAAKPFIASNIQNQARSELLGNTLQSAGNLQNLIQSLTTLGLQKEESRKQRNNQIVSSGLGAAGSAGAFCWVAEELYGIDDPRTFAIRAFMKDNVDEDGWLGDFARLYQSKGKEWAKEIQVNLEARETAMAIWDAFYALASVSTLKN